MRPSRNRAFTYALILALVAFFVTLTPRSAQARLPQQEVGPGIAPTPDRSGAFAKGWFFYRDECGNCEHVLENIIYPLLEQYPWQVDWQFYNIDDNFATWKQIEKHFTFDPSHGLPVSILGDTILVGIQQHESQLENLVQNAISGNHIDFPIIPGFDPSELISSDPRQNGSGNPELCSEENLGACAFDPPIHMAYFFTAGCDNCGFAEIEIAQLEKKFNLEIEKFNHAESAALALWMAEHTNIDPNFGSPAVFIGDHAWIGNDEIRLEKMEPVLEAIRHEGSPRFWDEYNASEGQSKLIEKFKDLGKVGLLLAGLIDGLNPCAFATIIFFVSYLTISNRKGKEILITGAMFTLGVFLAYFVVGIGFYKVLEKLTTIVKPIGLIINIITAVLCLIFAYLSIKDFFKARAGDTADMALNLPEGIRRRINKTIREGSRATRYYWGAFVTGLLISLLEFACTGQMYLPMITSMISMESMRGQGILWLGLYNLMFIIPLVIVFVLAYFGTTSKQLTDFFKKHAAAVKLGLALIYIALAIFLIVDILQRFGIAS
ncbi:MAG TPA: cytochrome c biogenesis protein CcdA [Anaerolineaceae bacterium]|nr:cytochrome c biogenesis protein CcdA [Anaerolineaceae bacterium]